MNKILLLFIINVILLFAGTVKNDFYDLSAISIDGDTISMDKFKNKTIMIVNVASQCGYTPQYSELQKLNIIYDSTLAILGFPSNDFLWQEPGENDEIKLFCQRNYGVTFQMFEKTHVKGKKIHPIYDWLSSKNQNGWNEQTPKWNFYKYVINKEGKLINFFPSSMSPLDSSITELIK